MTEAEWLTSENIPLMLKMVRARPNGRKIRLLVCAWCNRRWNALDERYQRGIEVAERFADGQATHAELAQARQEAKAARQMYGVPFAYARRIQYTDAKLAAAHLAQHPYDQHGPEVESARAEEKAAQLAILRDIFGNPFRPVTFDPAWRTSDVMLLAIGIYAERAFDRMPILADALQDAGCDSDDILTHLHDTQAAHVRGCWALDLILGKE